MDLARKVKELSPRSKALIVLISIGGMYFTNMRKSGEQGKEESFWKRLNSVLALLAKSKYRIAIAINWAALTACLVARTILSIQVAMSTGKIAQFMVQQKWPEFLSSISRFALLGIPAALVNSQIRYQKSVLSLRCRRALSEHINETYIVGVNFYKATQLPSTKIDNVAQRVTVDVEDFCNELTSLFNSVFKPVLDIVMNSAQLYNMMGYSAPLILFAYYAILAQVKVVILSLLQLKQKTEKRSQLQGDYSTAHQRLITYAEEIAFFEGSEREKRIISTLFDKLFDHAKWEHLLHALVGVIDQYLLKYGSSITGYSLLCIPAFFSGVPTTTAELTRGYVLNRQLLLDLSSAIGQLLSTTTKIASFSGTTARVCEVLERVQLLNADVVSNFQLRPDEEAENSTSRSGGPLRQKELSLASIALAQEKWLTEWREKGEALRTRKMERGFQSTASFAALHNAMMKSQTRWDAGERGVLHGRMRIVPGGIIELKLLDIVSPDGRLLVKGLNLEVPHGRNVMVTGPNGCGKSSLFRILGELWPPYGGEVVKPPKEDIVFVPQKPYLVLGTLRDQIIYPHCKKEMLAMGVSDMDLRKLLELVDPQGSILAEWGFDDERDWFNAFSGGQKQRVALARVFYHRPRYAILDECTSAVSSEVEGSIYLTCRALGITLFTISHRPQLQQYHDYQLKLDGHGGWTLHTREELDIPSPHDGRSLPSTLSSIASDHPRS